MFSLQFKIQIVYELYSSNYDIFAFIKEITI